MATREKWFDRRFLFDLPASRFPAVLERLRGTPARLEERVRGIPAAWRVERLDGSWSIQETAGHLLDLESLWLERARQIRTGAEHLAAADLTNRKTHEAGHNAAELRTLLYDFREARARLVAALDTADEAMIERAALHPRLNQPMRLIDLAFFLAEHDDHHLAGIAEILRRLGQ